MVRSMRIKCNHQVLTLNKVGMSDPLPNPTYISYLHPHRVMATRVLLPKQKILFNTGCNSCQSTGTLKRVPCRVICNWNSESLNELLYPSKGNIHWYFSHPTLGFLLYLNTVCLFPFFLHFYLAIYSNICYLPVFIIKRYCAVVRYS